MQEDSIYCQGVRCYDKGEKVFERYTVVYMDQPLIISSNIKYFLFNSITMSKEPLSKEGCFKQTCTNITDGWRKIGKRIPFYGLPCECQKLVEKDIEEQEEKWKKSHHEYIRFMY
jgi:hypothetical protein